MPCIRYIGFETSASSSYSGMWPSTASHSQSMWAICSRSSPWRPLFLTLPSCPVIRQWNGSIMPEVTPVRKICARWVTSGGSSRLSSTSMTPLFMPHQ